MESRRWGTALTVNSQTRPGTNSPPHPALKSAAPSLLGRRLPCGARRIFLFHPRVFPKTHPTSPPAAQSGRLCVCKRQICSPFCTLVRGQGYREATIQSALVVLQEKNHNLRRWFTVTLNSFCNCITQISNFTGEAFWTT